MSCNHKRQLKPKEKPKQSENQKLKQYVFKKLNGAANHLINPALAAKFFLINTAPLLF